MPTITLNPDGSFPLAEITAELYRLTDEYSIETYPAKHREHLGASAIGEECYRKLYYDFRWVKLQNAEPRMRRLWARGHSEEEKMWYIFKNGSIQATYYSTSELYSLFSSNKEGGK